MFYMFVLVMYAASAIFVQIKNMHFLLSLCCLISDIPYDKSKKAEILSATMRDSNVYNFIHSASRFISVSVFSIDRTCRSLRNNLRF